MLEYFRYVSYFNVNMIESKKIILEFFKYLSYNILLFMLLVVTVVAVVVTA
jgi:hypothetical protein